MNGVKVTFKISMLDLGTKSSVQALGVSNLCWTPVLRLNARSAQPMSGPVFSSNSGFVKPSLDEVLGYLE